MFWYQAYYTSCRINGCGGFKVCAQSEGLSADDLDEIVRYGLHRPPLYLHNLDATHAQCPTAFRWLKLNSTRYVLQKSHYLGLDDTGRDGNFFTHSLISTTPYPRVSTWMIDCLLWSGWQNAFTDSAHTPSLPVVELPSTTEEITDMFSWENLAMFLHKQSERVLWLEYMLAGLFLPAQKIVIIDEKEYAPYWLACLTKLLPRDTANRLTFSTYQKNRLPAVNIVVTVPEVAWASSPEEMLCDVQTTLPQNNPNIPEKAHHYAQKLVSTLYKTPQNISNVLETFTRFKRK